jgi:DNA-binding transcriptional ArsR family regulator
VEKSCSALDTCYTKGQESLLSVPYFLKDNSETISIKDMPDKSKKFHEFALKSILFKGRADWYFCYLKAERIAHVLAILHTKGAQGRELGDLLHASVVLPQEIAHLAAGEVHAEAVLADIFALLSQVRLAAAQSLMTTEQGGILAKEYEGLAERLMQGSHPSPFASAEDFYVPDLPREPVSLPLPSIKPIKDIKDMSFISKGHTSIESDRSARILAYLKEKKAASIKDIAGVISDLSEKTIQRELNALIRQGLVRRVGERRWSQYLLV